MILKYCTVCIILLALVSGKAKSKRRRSLLGPSSTVEEPTAMIRQIKRINEQIIKSIPDNVTKIEYTTFVKPMDLYLKKLKVAEDRLAKVSRRNKRLGRVFGNFKSARRSLIKVAGKNCDEAKFRKHPSMLITEPLTSIAKCAFEMGSVTRDARALIRIQVNKVIDGLREAGHTLLTVISSIFRPPMRPTSILMVMLAMGMMGAATTGVVLEEALQKGGRYIQYDNKNKTKT